MHGGIRSIHAAASSGSLEIVKDFVEHGADVNCRNSRVGSPLQSAISSGSLEIVKYLVEHGADVNYENSQVGTPLHSAVLSDSLEIVKYLVERGANVNWKNFQIDSPLQFAASFGSLELVKYLVQRGADLNCEDDLVSSPLHSAASSGSLEIVKYLVEHGSNVNCENVNIGTPLHSAVSSDSMEIVEYLVEHGADLNWKNYVIDSPLQSAASSGSLELVKYLVEHGAYLNYEDDLVGSPLHSAASSGSLEIVKYLVERGADVNCKNNCVCSLHPAASSGSLEIVKYLVEHGADLNCVDDMVGSPLHSAASSGSLEIVKYLVEHGVDVNCENNCIYSPLHSAVSSRSLEIVKYLVEHGANVNCGNYRIGSPLHLAVSAGLLIIAKYLVEHGADVKYKNPRNKPVIYIAVESHSLEMVEYLLEHGAELTNEGNHDTSAILFVACETGNSAIVDYLLQHGAIEDLNSWKLDSPLRIACWKGHTSVVQTLVKYDLDIRKEKEPLLCVNNQIINILNVELKKSLKHRKQIQILKGLHDKNLTRVGPPLKYFSPQKSLTLGNGSMGTSVYVGIMEDGAEVAVKRILKQQYEVIAQNELQILSRIDPSKSPFIVSYRTVLQDAIFVYIVLDLCEETLEQHVGTQTSEYLQDHGPRMIKEILSGIEFLHSQNILHRDLKPSNVLVDVESHMRLADFGISRVLKEEETTVHTSASGTGGWMAAEVIEVIDNKEIGRFKKKSDVQVAGMIAFFILTKGKHPFGGRAFERMTNISKGNPVNLDMLDDLQVQKFISWLISHKIDDRPYAHEALADPFMVHIPFNDRGRVTVEDGNIYFHI